MTLCEDFKSHPAVYAVGKEYQVAVVTNRETLMWVRVGDREFYDESNGILRSARPLHFVSVPVELLDEAGEYTVCYRRVIERKAYYSETSEVFEVTYRFYPIGDGDIRIYHISDAHDKIEAPISAGGWFGGSPDLLVLNGDIRNHSDDPTSLYAIHEIAGRITGGERPTVFSRGNHDTRGKYAENFADYTPTDHGASYFTFRLGGLWGIVVDCGEDKRDPQIEYGNTICCHAFRLRETDFLNSVIENADKEYAAEGVTKRMVICHIPFTHTMRPPFDIEQELYREWTELIGDNIKPDFYLCGHMHELDVWYPGGDHDDKGQSCPVIVGGTPITYEGDTEYVGCAIKYCADNVKVYFTDADKKTVGEDEFNIPYNGR